MTGLAVCSALLLISYLVNSCLVVAIDNPIEAFPPGIDEGDLGLEIIDSGDQDDELILPSANPMSKPFVCANHKIRVLSKYHIGYDLSVIATTGGEGGVDNRVMHGRAMGGVIQSTNDGMLANNSWGITTASPDAGSSNWRGFNDNPVQVLLKNRGELSQSDTPDISETDVYYGVKIDYSTPADTYLTTVKYTLSQRIPNAPAVIKLDRSEYAIGDDDVNNRLIHLTGVRFDMVTGVGVDFNGDSKINDGEGCTDWSRENGNSTNDATCNLPVFDFQRVNSANVPGEDEFGGMFNLLLQDNTDRVVPSGHQITYYYQPRIDSAEVLNSESDGTLKIKDSVGVIDMASTDSASMMLTDDGDVYLWGNTPIYDGSQKVFDKTMAPMTVKFPDSGLTHTDPVTSITGYGKSYFAVSRQGYVYGWGNNSEHRLTLGDDGEWVALPKASAYYNSNENNRQARKLSFGDGFGVTINKPKEPDYEWMSSWGKDDQMQRGNDEKGDGAVGESWMVGGVARGSYPLDIESGEQFVDVAAGKAHTIVLTNNGRVYTWGAHGASNGVVGDDRLGWSTSNDAARPHDITKQGNEYLSVPYHDEGKTFIDIAAGNNFSMALAQGREGDDKTYLYTFGANDRGQLGKGGGSSEHRAYEISDLFQLGDEEQIVGITASGKSAAAWTNYGSLYVWGDNANGRLGAVGDAMLSVPTRVPNVNNVDDAVLGIVNYAHTTTGRVVTWGGSYENFLSGSTGDITDWLTNPTYLIKVTGRHLNLAVADTWVDFNDNGLMDELERPLAKSCDETSCYLQISTLGIAGGDINTNGYSVRVVTAVNTNHAGTSNDDVKLKAARQLARNATRVTVEKPITKRQAKSNDTDDSSETEVSSIEGADEMANAVADKDEASSSDDTSNADDAEKAGDEKIDVDDGENGSSDIGDNADNVDEDDNLDESNNGNNTDQSGCKITVNDDCGLTSECVECVSDEQCECTYTYDNDGCTDHNEADRDDSKTAGVCMFVGHGLDADNLSIDDHVNKDLVSSFSSGAQIQLIDGRCKGCFDSVGSINVDD